MVPIAQLLLQLADSPHQVRFVTRPEAGFEVPQKLFDKFEKAYQSDASSAADTSDVSPNTADDKQEATTPKRRGRTRKQGEEK
jgi:hypothetical protein